MELLTLEKILLLAFLDKGIVLYRPNIKYYVCSISFLGEKRIVLISKRSMKHILEKNNGIHFGFNLRRYLSTYRKVLYISERNRFVFISDDKEIDRVVGVVLEQKENKAWIVTCMIADEKFLTKKYPCVWEK